MLYDEGVAVLKKQLDSELVIGASLIMSCFCYSIFRLDPYVGCQHSCSYCYTRFLPSHKGEYRAVTNYAKLLRRVLEQWKGSGVPFAPFRLSALTDPFQPLERRLSLTLKVMKVAAELKVPLIISTKSTLVARSPWLDIIKELADEGLVIVQLSVAFLSDEIAKEVEKGAPPPSERLKAAELLKDEGVPIVLRLQPLIPFLNSSEEFFEAYTQTARSVGARHVIIEALRISKQQDLECFRAAMSRSAFAKLTDRALWELYPQGVHKRPRKEWRHKIYALAVERFSREGLSVGLCREGFFGLDTASDCCGIFLLREKVLRITLREQLHGFKPGYHYITFEDIEKIPLPGVKRKLREHAYLVQRVISNTELLHRVIS